MFIFTVKHFQEYKLDLEKKTIEALWFFHYHLNFAKKKKKRKNIFKGAKRDLQ